jgi:signal transduction histidine kinase
MFHADGHDLPIEKRDHAGPAPRTDAAARVLAATARELAAPTWALGVRSSPLRRGARVSRRERELLDFVAEHAGRIARVLAGVFDFLYLEERGELPVDPRPCAMEDVCAAAVEELREAGFRAPVSYEAEGDGEGDWDPGRLAQAISYLLELASAEAASDAPIALRWRGDDEEVVVRVEVGRGQIPARIDALWGSSLDEGQGGLRAVLARSVATAHGGVLARFASDGASAFVMALPRRAPEDPQHPTQH